MLTPPNWFPRCFSFIALLLASNTDARITESIQTNSLFVDRLDDTALATACTDQPADCSLRGAIIAANGAPGYDIVVVPSGIFTLTIAGILEDAALTGDLDISEPVTIQGSGRDATIISGNGLDRVFHILTGTTDSLFSDLTITLGNTINYPNDIEGGGILVSVFANLTLSNTAVVSNTSQVSGGGVLNMGRLTLLHSAILSNSATLVLVREVVNGPGLSRANDDGG